MVAKAANGARIVMDDADRLRFLDELRRVVSSHGWLCMAYCMLDTHVHVVICTPEPNLGDGMKLLLGDYAITYNRRLGRSGYVFARPFWSRRVDKPYYVRCAVLCTVLNPVAAGLCRQPSEFRWSSYNETVGAVPPSGLLDPEILLRPLDEDAGRARIMFREVVDDAVERLAARRGEVAWWKAVEAAAATQGRG